VSGQAEKVGTGRARKQRLGKTGARGKKHAGRRDNRQTDNTGINALGDNGEDGRHLEGGGDKHKDHVK
jgi:hypothetical protein